MINFISQHLITNWVHSIQKSISLFSIKRDKSYAAMGLYNIMQNSTQTTFNMIFCFICLKVRFHDSIGAQFIKFEQVFFKLLRFGGSEIFQLSIFLCVVTYPQSYLSGEVNMSGVYGGAGRRPSRGPEGPETPVGRCGGPPPPLGEPPEGKKI